MHYRRILPLIAAASLLGWGLPSSAYDNTPPREQRMDEALQNYRSADPRNPQPGPAARAEQNIKEGARNAGAATKRGAQRTGEAVKHGAQRTGEAVKHGAQRSGEAVKHGAQRAGQAVGTGVEKTGDAIRRGGEKLKDKSSG